MPDYTTSSNSEPFTVAPVAITSVDVVNQQAGGLTRHETTVMINTAYYVGGVQVTPSIGDQWYVQQIRGVWRLYQKIPFNDPNQSTIPTQGQVQVGSGKGPVELQGTQINANAPLRLSTVTTSGRPSASSVDPGTMMYDLTLSKPIFSDGTTWRDAGGSSV